MEKTALKGSLFKMIKSPITSGITGLVTGSAGGALYGKKKGVRIGAETMADELGKAFVTANAKENRMLHDTWQEKNKVENAQIAQHFLRKGYQMGQGVQKVAEEITNTYNASFDNELQKLASESDVAERFNGMSKEAKANILKSLFGSRKMYANIGKIFKGNKSIGNKAVAVGKQLKNMPGTVMAGGAVAGYGAGKVT